MLKSREKKERKGQNRGKFTSTHLNLVFAYHMAIRSAHFEAIRLVIKELRGACAVSHEFKYVTLPEVHNEESLARNITKLIS
jgi:hypothetical protein